MTTRRLLLLLLLAIASAHAALAGEPVIHASELAAAAREHGAACRYDEARELLRRAIREARGVPGDTAAALSARLEAQSLELKRQSAVAKTALRDARALLE